MRKPRKQIQAKDLAAERWGREERPLYAGVVSKPIMDHYGHPSTISLPLVRWMEKR